MFVPFDLYAGGRQNVPNGRDLSRPMPPPCTSVTLRLMTDLLGASGPPGLACRNEGQIRVIRRPRAISVQNGVSEPFRPDAGKVHDDFAVGEDFQRTRSIKGIIAGGNNANFVNVGEGNFLDRARFEAA